MSYKIEINADSLSELGGKLLALASQFHATASTPAIDPVMSEVREAEDKPKRARKAKAEEPQEDAGNAAQIAADPSPTSNSAQGTQTAETAQSPSEPAAQALDFENDVAPVVIDAVGKIGKEAVSEVLSQFGAARASEVDPAQWSELVDALKAKL